MLRLLWIALLSLVFFGCIYLIVLLSYAKAHDSPIFSGESMIGALPLFAIALVILGLGALSALKDKE